jgi:DNA-binding beta-propeller fold protein YncE/mono/diheme cytochrome c family protein
MLKMKSLLYNTVICCTAFAACEPINQNQLGAGSHAATSQLGISGDGATIYVLAPDADEIIAMDAVNGQVKGKASIQGYPHRLTVLEDGRVAVVARYAGTVTVLSSDLKTAEEPVEVGADPFGVIEVGAHLVVAVAGQKELARIPKHNPSQVEDRVALEHAQPRGLAVTDEGKLFVSHFSAGKLSTVDLEQGVPQWDTNMQLHENPRFFPNQMDALTLTPDQSQIAAPHQENNNDPDQFANGGDMNGNGSNSVAYYSDGPTGYPAVVPAVSRVDTKTGLLLSKGPGPFDATQTDKRGMVSAVMNPHNRKHLSGEKVVEPTATAFAHDGRLEMVLFRGSGRLLFRRSIVGDNQNAVVAIAEVETGASSLVVSPDGNRVFVWNAFDYTIRAFDIPNVTYKDETSDAVSIANRTVEPNGGVFGDRPIPRIEPILAVRARDQSLPASLQTGRNLFYGVAPSVSRSGTISCASCHPDGMADGITWQFAQGPRQTPALWGGIGDTAPFHWDQGVESTDDLNDTTIVRMGGSGLSAEHMSDLWSFIDSIPIPAAPQNANEASVTRGSEIFFSEEASCTTCHAGADFTDHASHDVGSADTVGIENDFVQLQAHFATPVLHGLSYSAPYMHDGSATTLRDLVDQYVATDKMGKGSHLSEQDKDDLAAFLETL